MSVQGVGLQVPSMAPMPEYHGIRQDAGAAGNAVKQENNASTSQKPHLIESTAHDLQRIGNAFNKKLRFEVDHQSDRVIVKVIDKETDKVIRELPPEELQRLHQNLKEAIGLLFDELV